FLAMVFGPTLWATNVKAGGVCDAPLTSSSFGTSVPFNEPSPPFGEGGRNAALAAAIEAQFPNRGDVSFLAEISSIAANGCATGGSIDVRSDSQKFSGTW